MFEKEETWILKNRATWLECGDENTKFFHAFARGRKAQNIIWSLLDEHGDTHTTFEGMSRTRVEHFKHQPRHLLQKSSELLNSFQGLLRRKTIGS